MLIFPIGREKNLLEKLRIDNAGVMKATLDAICEDERAAILLAKSYNKK